MRQGEERGGRAVWIDRERKTRTDLGWHDVVELRAW